MDVAGERGAPPARSFYQNVLLLSDGRLWRIFLLGIASGFPWILHTSILSLWLKDLGLSLGTIGLIGVAGTVYAINFLWAPVLDHVRLPGLHRMGQRRSWIFICQIALLICAIVLASIGMKYGLGFTVVIVLVIVIASATQDMAIDAYRITIIREDEPHMLGHAAAMATSGWWVGFSFPGMIGLWVVDDIGYQPTYFLLSTLLIVVAGAVLLVFREPEKMASSHRRREGLGETLDSMLEAFESYLAAVTEFFRRNGVALALGILSFIFLFKIGEAFLGKMVILFYDDVGYTKGQIGTYSKGIGLLVTITGACLTGLMMARFGTMKGLFLAGIAMASTNLIFAWIAKVGPDPNLFLLAVVSDGLTSSVSTVAFVAFISKFTSRVHTATQYAAMASIGNAGRTTLAASSGYLVQGLDNNWALFFVITALMVVPSLILLLWLTRRVRQHYGSAR